MVDISITKSFTEIRLNSIPQHLQNFTLTMDWITGFTIMAALIFMILLVFMCVTDSDIPTMFYSYTGKDPADVLQDKVVWITGASSGIGEAIAKELSKSPSPKIVLTARRVDELSRVKKECLALNPKRDKNSILVLPMDLTNYCTHEPALQKILSLFGKLDILISNAGRSQRASWPQTDLAVDKELFDLNVFSVINLNRIVVRHFLEGNRGGQLVVMSSIAGKVGVYHSGSYSGSKFALHGYFNSLRNETYSNNIDITIICPGPVFSPILRQAFTSQSGQVVNQDYPPDDRRLTAERCAHLSLVAIANKLEESWVALFPIVFFMYLASYQPYIFAKVNKFVHSRGLYLKARGTKERLI